MAQPGLWKSNARRRPTLSKGFHLAAADVGATRKLLVAPVAAPSPMREGIEVMNPLAAALLLAQQS